MYLRKFSLEFVACKLSLNRNWQGYTTSFSTSLVRYKSSKQNRHLFQVLNNLPKGTNHSFLSQRDIHTTVTMAEEFVEEYICKEDDIPENELKLYTLANEDMKVLVVKQKGKIYAIGTKCPHYGAPLLKGYLGNGRVRCQWHGACFNIESGDIEDFPGLDSLPSYEVTITDGRVYVRGSKQLLLSNKRVLPFMRDVGPQNGTYLVVGGGPAGATCVETLRAQGFDGRICFIFSENILPYDRVKLSKNLNIKTEDIRLRPMEFYQERKIEVIPGTTLTQLQVTKKEAVFDNGTTMKYDRIFLATGSTARTLEVDGADLQNIFVLRTAEDAQEIRAALNETTQVVILGTSFIGMEVASYCAGKVGSITVVGKRIPFQSLFGKEIGNRILHIFQEKGIRFELNRTIERFIGEDGVLKSVVLTGDVTIPADVCIIGIGTTPNTSYLESSGIQRKPDGTVEVNDYLQTSSHDVFAGGDIATAPVLGHKVNIAHWGIACYHGNVAAYNMLGWEKQLKTIPFFWTMIFGKGIRYAGYAKSFDETVIAGDLNDLAFIAFHCSGENVVAVTCLNRDPLASKFAEWLYEGKKLKKSQINEWVTG